MQFVQTNPATSQERQSFAVRCALLKEHLRSLGVKNSDLAKRFNVSHPMISRVLNSSQAPKRYIDVLNSEYGVPPELLPVPTPGRPGPKPSLGFSLP